MRATLLALIACASPGLAETGDPEEGARLFRACASCHAVGADAENGIGPMLNGVLGRSAGSVEGARYSEAMIASGITWDAASLDAYLADPRGVVPGTRMSYRGMPDAADRAHVIAYLATFSEATEADALSTEAVAILARDTDPAYGEWLARECTGCHKPGADAGIPPISGMEAGAFVTALLGYRDGSRAHQVMQTMAGRLTDDDIAALAAHFATPD